MRARTIAVYLCLTLSVILPLSSFAQCKKQFDATQTGLVCKINPKGKSKLAIEDENGNSTKIGLKKAKKLTAQEQLEIKNARANVSMLLEQMQSVSSSGAGNQSVANAFDYSLVVPMVSIGLSTASAFDIPSNPKEYSDEWANDTSVDEALKNFESVEEALKVVEAKNKKLKNKQLEKCLQNKLKANICESEFKCGNGKDEDGDGLVDCDDPDCVGKGKCGNCVDVQIPAQFQIKTAYSSNGNNCGTISIVQWSDSDDEGATSWTVHYSWNGDPRSYSSSPPFDDSFNLHGSTFTVPAGSHWDTIGGGSHASNFTGDADCSDKPGIYTSALSNPYVVVNICKGSKK